MDRCGSRLVQVLFCLLGVSLGIRYTPMGNRVFIQNVDTEYILTIPGLFSSIQCAAACMGLNAGEYSFEDGECHLYGRVIDYPPLQTSLFSLSPVNVTNVALHKPSQASTNTGQSHLVNDQYTCASGSCCFSSSTSAPYWWIVDLEAAYIIYTVKVLRLSDYRGVEMFIGKELGTPGDFSGFQSLGTFLIGRPDSRTIVYQNLQGIEGQYVGLSMNPVGAYALRVCDVQVMAIPAPPAPLVPEQSNSTNSTNSTDYVA
ncbi:uncharacterized protein LOC143022347 [Oratosquilla oratoria]|uniref:uncharacterized protein LOC143022347 n=1 Tax=Oratosquilla oratoria TaxID=337810 RepID=UPI003F7754B5